MVRNGESVADERGVMAIVERALVVSKSAKGKRSPAGFAPVRSTAMTYQRVCLRVS